MSFEVSQLAAGYLSVGARPTIHSDFGREHRGTDASDAPAEFDTLLASWPGATAPVSKLRPPPPAAPRRRPSTLEPMEVPVLALPASISSRVEEPAKAPGGPLGPASAKRNARSECSNTSTTEFPDNVVEDECGVFVMEPALESDDEDGGLGAFMMAPTVESDDDFDRPVEFDLVELDDAKKESKQSSEPFNDDGGSPPMGMSPVLASALQMVGKHTSTGDRLPFRQSSE
eukprot:TRINITY_DN1559_c0_g2_i7.p1 TRINITY_DN1559_c0_g2~~TRINITY_DN1559_c0_g2_i7.p1  ORF type:complete len:230 (-),score=39.85 TRINITY_DN1559_c0_g2_i7:433-1122(-)